MGQGATNMDTMLGSKHLTKDIQDLLLIIRDGLKFKKGNSKLNVKQHTLFPMVFLFSHFNLGVDLEEL